METRYARALESGRTDARNLGLVGYGFVGLVT